MKKNSNNLTGSHWKKIAAIAILVLAVGYTYGRPHLERMLGIQLPAINGQQDPEDDRSTVNDDNNPFPDDAYNATLPDAKTENSTGSGNGNHSAAVSKPNSGSKTDSKRDLYTDFFKSTGRNKYMSPAGLVYTMGPGGEHRIDHVLRHAKDNTSRPSHGVFVGDQFEIFERIDEAYEMIKAKSKYVKTSQEGNRTNHTISMKDPVGYEGGQKGQRNGSPKLRKLKLILQSGNNVVTAYPYR